MEIFSAQNVDLFIKLFLAMFLGVLIGTERVLAHKTAGMRTYALVSMGSAFFIIISQLMTEKYLGAVNLDPLRIASQIIVGIGFLGAGSIMLKDYHPIGLTTASGIWVAAGIGMAVGFGLYVPAVIVTVLTIFIFAILALVEERIRIKTDKEGEQMRKL